MKHSCVDSIWSIIKLIKSIGTQLKNITFLSLFDQFKMKLFNKQPLKHKLTQFCLYFTIT